MGNELRARGAQVWIDEAEIEVGDSLIDKISDALENVDYLVVLLSHRSVKSEWVKRELNIAITQEIHGKRVKVLPCRLDKCKMPPFLLDKKYADFGDHWGRALGQLAKALRLPVNDRSTRFLAAHVFHDLRNLNTGFDAPGIWYFTAEGFETVMRRCEYFEIEIYGVEVVHPGHGWQGTETYEPYPWEASDPRWYWGAYEVFKRRGISSYFSASYGIPEEILDLFVKENDVPNAQPL